MAATALPNREIDLLHRIDKLLENSAKTLIEVANAQVRGRQISIPLWISDSPDADPHPDEAVLPRAILCTTFQHLWKFKRRFDWLTGDTLKHLENLESLIISSVAPENRPQSLKGYIDYLASTIFGNLNPWTSAQVFRVLVYGGESVAHRGIGLLAFFSMMLSLRYLYSDGIGRRVARTNWRPTAFLASKCLFPIKSVVDIRQRRAEYYSDIKAMIKEIDQLPVDGRCPWQHWKFASKLDRLSTQMSDLQLISLVPGKFADSANRIEKIAGDLRVGSETKDVWRRIYGIVVEAFQAIGTESEKLADQGEQVISMIQDEFITKLSTRDKAGLDKLGIPIPEWMTKVDFKEVHAAAEQALEICEPTLDILRKISHDCSPRRLKGVHTLQKALDTLAEQNCGLAKLFHNAGEGIAKWCCSVVEREIAHASAHNDMDFDPAELVSGIATAVHWREMTNTPEVSDAVEKAVEAGCRADGSWHTGQPFFSSHRVLAAHPITSDIIWTLASVLKQRPELEVADRALAQYVNWLEKTVTQVGCGRSIKTGWASERSWECKRIDIWATALTVQALMEIRDLLESRLWQACARRFTTPVVTKPLAEIDPVDLGAQHAHRLHHRLIKMARTAEMGGPNAEYAFMFHGPPGSSKTAMAEALAEQMWRNPTAGRRPDRRLIRITPADFTRHGESGMDSEAHAIFHLLRHTRGIVILFDEIDDLLRRRESKNPLAFMELLTPSMLNRLADLREACPRQEICFIFSTNFIEKIDPALLRKGRLDDPIPVVYPDTESRAATIERKLQSLKSRAQEYKGLPEAAWLQDAIGKLEGLRGNIVEGSRFWPWKELDKYIAGLCDDLIDDAKAKSQERNLVDTKKGTKNLVLVTNGNREPLFSGRQHRASPKIPIYDPERLAEIENCGELEKEILYYSFAGWPTLETYRQGFNEEFAKWIPENPNDRRVVTRGVNLWNNQGRSGCIEKTRKTEPKKAA